MRKIAQLVIIATAGILLMPVTLSSQTWLKEYAKQRGLQMSTEKAFAESLAAAKNMPVRLEKEDGILIEIKSFKDDRPYYYKTDNINAAKTLSTNKVWPGGGYDFSLTGEDVILGEWDGGTVRTSHQEFGGRVLLTQGSVHYHSTHVAGTMIAAGVKPNAKGMSYQASLHSYDWTSDDAEMAAAAAAGLRISNHSYGIITGWDYDTFGDDKWVWWGDTEVSETEDYEFGFYDSDAKAWDNISYNAPYYLIVKSAGNDRGEGPLPGKNHWVFIDGSWVLRTTARNKDGNNDGYDCIGHGGLGKNVLTVGAVSAIPGGYTQPSDVVMSDFSCWGPTDDGRIKPDIVADGINLYSTLETGDAAYGYLSGTSMATPNATGSAGLLLHYQGILHGSTPMRSSTLKALIINSADEAGPYPGPDYIHGWGLMNTLRAASVMRADSADGFGSHIEEIVLNQDDTVRFDVGSEGIDPLVATIAWIDLPKNPVTKALDPTTRMLINDIDIRIFNKRTGQEYSPWTLDPSSPTAAATTGDNIRDNVEHIGITATERTNYTVQITHKGTLAGGSQNVSLVIRGNGAPHGPAFFTQTDGSEYSIIPAAVVHDSIKIENRGDSELVMTVSVPDSFGKWLSTDDESADIGPMDSAYLHYTVSAESLGTWEDYSGFITMTHNDTAISPALFNVILHTLGPTIGVSAGQLIIEVDSGAVQKDTIKLRNSGYIPLSFSINDTGTSNPAWLTLNNSTGTVAINDSVPIIITSNNPSQPVGIYHTNLIIESNDTQTGVIDIPLTLYVGMRRALTTEVRDRWNIISLPVQPFTDAKTELYPTAISEAIAYNGSYEDRISLQTGEGYWMKFNGNQSIPVDGYVFKAETLALDQGWNLIGSLSNPIPSNAIISDPPDIITSFLFGYNNNYFIADSLIPGKGYWIQLDQPGELILNSVYPPLPKTSATGLLGQLSRLTISDGIGSQILYFGSPNPGGSNFDKNDMPPKAPDPSFDARFSSGKIIQKINTETERNEYPIQIQTSASSVTIHWDIKRDETTGYALVEENGKSHTIVKTGKLILEVKQSEPLLLKLTASTLRIPEEFALEQNYPNPFNPETKIEYALPVQSYVNIKVYNVLGNEVTTLVDAVKKSGYHSVNFNASDLPSGIYFYKMKTDGFASLKKMVLMR